MVNGAYQWYQCQRLTPTQSMLRMKNQFLVDRIDPLARFVREHLELLPVPSHRLGKPQDAIWAEDLYGLYQTWTLASHQPTFARTKFFRLIGTKATRGSTGGVEFYYCKKISPPLQ